MRHCLHSIPIAAKLIFSLDGLSCVEILFVDESVAQFVKL